MPVVRMRTSAAGTNFEFRSGDEVEVPPAQAQAWVADGVAEWVAEERTATPERGRPRPERRKYSR